MIDFGRERHRARVDLETGSATLLVALWVVVLVMLGVAGLVLGAILAVRSSVATAADLGALAGATATLEQPDQACPRAASVIRANGAQLVSCRSVGTDVWVVASAEGPRAVAWLLGARSGRLQASAHAALVPEEPP